MKMLGSTQLLCERERILIDEDAVDNQIALIRGTEIEFKNISDPMFSLHEGEGQVIRRTLAALINSKL